MKGHIITQRFCIIQPILCIQLDFQSPRKYRDLVQVKMNANVL